MISCEKEVDSLNNSQNGIDYLTKSNSIQKINGVLIFPDTAFVSRTLALLDAEITQEGASFNGTYGHLSEAEIENLIDSIGYNENKPLVDFEAGFAFQSLRSKIETDEINWLLNTSGEKIEDDPDNHFISDDVVRSILTENSEVGIGTSLYKVVDNGYYEITDGNFVTLYSLRSNPIDISGKPNVIFYADGEMKNGCKSSKRDARFKYNSNNTRRIKWVVSHWTYPWGRYAKAKTYNYKKKNNKWKKYKTYCEAQVYGNISESDGNCSTAHTFNTPAGYYVFENNKKDVKHKVKVSTKTKSGWVKGYHEGAGGISHTSTLTW